MATRDMNEYEEARPRRGRRIGCLIAAILAAAGSCLAGAVLAVLFFVFGLLRDTWAYTEGMSALRASPAAQAQLGQPIEASWLFSGNVSTSNDSGQAELAIPVSGPEGSGDLVVEARKQAGEWSFRVLRLDVDGEGASIDLLEED